MGEEGLGVPGEHREMCQGHLRAPLGFWTLQSPLGEGIWEVDAMVRHSLDRKICKKEIKLLLHLLMGSLRTFTRPGNHRNPQEQLQTPQEQFRP